MAHKNLATTPVTREHFETLSRRKTFLEKYREEVLVRLQAAREMGDLSENGAYKAARFELSDTDRELKRLRYRLHFAEVKEPTLSDTVDFGSRVTIRNETLDRTFLLVSADEADPLKHKLSIESPIGQAILGKKKGALIEVQTPQGNVSYTIEKVE